MGYTRVMLVVLVMMTILGLTTCGSESEDVPSLDTGVKDREVEPTASAADKVLDNEAKMMALTQCLRDQGIEVLDPVVDADGNVGKPEFAEGTEVSKKEWGPAWEACAEHLEGFTYEKERVDVSEEVDRWVEVAACLRDKGHNLDEPTAETLDQWMGDFKRVLNWDDPADVADYEDCTGEEAGGKKGK